MSKDTKANHSVVVVLLAVDFFQMMGFPLSPAKAFPWDQISVVDSVTQLLGLFSFSSLADLVSPDILMVGYFLCFAWIVAVVAAVLWCGYSFSNQKFRALWPLKFLRFGARVTTTGLYIPLTSMLMSMFQCPAGGTWQQTGWTCWSAQHLTLTIAATALIPLLAAISLIVAACFFDRLVFGSKFTPCLHFPSGVRCPRAGWPRLTAAWPSQCCP